jgi:hypothetical protein
MAESRSRELRAGVDELSALDEHIGALRQPRA